MERASIGCLTSVSGGDHGPPVSLCRIYEAKRYAL
jgi:hypothetical protein